MKKRCPPGYFSEQIAEAKRFHLDLNTTRSLPLSVVSAGLESCSPDYEIHRSSFPFFGMEFVAQGRGTVCFGKDPVEILPGSVFSYGPRTAHDIVTDPDEPLVKYFVDFTGTRARALLKQHCPVPGSVIQSSAPGEVMAVFDDLIRNGLKLTSFGGRIATVILERLLLTIEETSIPNGSSGSPAFSTYRRCHHCIQENWHDLRSLGDIAEKCHVDPAYLCRLFQRFDRQSPYQLLLRLKINHAADRLMTGEVAVARIAEELQFSDQFHFSRVFKKLMGTPPSRFARVRGR